MPVSCSFHIPKWRLAGRDSCGRLQKILIRKYLAGNIIVENSCRNNSKWEISCHWILILVHCQGQSLCGEMLRTNYCGISNLAGTMCLCWILLPSCGKFLWEILVGSMQCGKFPIPISRGPGAEGQIFRGWSAGSSRSTW